MPPVLVAEVMQKAGIVGGNATLIFTFNEDVNPPINSNNVLVSFDNSSVSTLGHLSVQIEGNEVTVTISSLHHSNEGSYSVTVDNGVRTGTAHTFLTLKCE